MTRREIFHVAGAAMLAAPLAHAETVPNPKGHLGMGCSPTALGNRRPAATGGGRGASLSPDDLIDYCHSIGMGGAEVGAPPTDPAAISKMRDKLQSWDMHVIFNVPLPRTEADVELFDAGVKAAKAVGGYGLHAAMTQRRYEEFTTVAAYRQSFENNQKVVALAEPVLRKHKVRLALENHKGWSAVEQAAWLKRLGSEYVGVHLDFGNNVSFLEDPMFTLETLKPYIFSAHIKDMAVQPYEDGFLLSEVPFGEGFLDLKKMVDILRAKDPNMVFDLEMITRDPLKVPMYKDSYWVTFADMPARQVAWIAETVQKRSSKKPLPTVAGLDAEARKKLEEEYNLACLRYARQNLGL